MKNIFFLATAAIALSASSAYAGSFNLGFFAPAPVYVPQPVYVAPPPPRPIYVNTYYSPAFNYYYPEYYYDKHEYKHWKKYKHRGHGYGHRDRDWDDD